MQALGLIETRGLIAAVESADAMLKAADVTLLEKTYAGGGLVSITVTGEVAAVSSAIEAGITGVRRINSTLLVSHHVIPRPNEELEGLIVPARPMEVVVIQTFDTMEDELKRQTQADIPALDKSLSVDAVFDTNRTESIHEINKNTIDDLVREQGIEEALAFIDTLKVAKLRSLAREYKTMDLAGRMISKAGKKTLLDSFNKYYSWNDV